MSKRLIFFFFVILFFQRASYGALSRFDVYGGEKLYHDLSQVCLEQLNRSSPIIDIIDHKTLDCMGERADVTEFCYQKNKTEEGYLRGYVDQKLKKVICQRAQRLIVQYRCVDRDLSVFCEEAARGCAKVKEIFAKNIPIIHQSLIERKSIRVKELNCYFEVPRNLDVIEN
jgi:hypothetical protein